MTYWGISFQSFVSESNQSHSYYTPGMNLDQLQERIFNAFGSEPLDIGPDLEQAIEISLQGVTRKRELEYDSFFVYVGQEEIISKCIIAGLDHFNPLGIRFFIGLYLWLYSESQDLRLAHVLVDFLCTFGEQHLELLCKLNGSQKEVVRDVLETMGNSLEPAESKRIDFAIEKFWARPITDSPMPKHYSKAYLRELIFSAFEGVELGNGVSLHTTIYHDNYGSVDEETRARMETDPRNDWSRFVTEEMHRSALKTIDGIGGTAFFDDKGLRFHLPAYMMVAVEEEVYPAMEFFLYNITSPFSEYTMNRLSILNEAQRSCVRTFLKFIRDCTGLHHRLHHLAIQESIDGYWSN